MKKSLALLLALALIFAFPVTASAAETTEARVPVTLTVVNTVSPISCYNSSIGKTRIKMQTFRIIAKNPSHENAASKLVPAAVRFFVLAKFVRSKQHSALLYETAVLLFSPLSTRGYAMI